MPLHAAHTFAASTFKLNVKVLTNSSWLRANDAFNTIQTIIFQSEAHAMHSQFHCKQFKRNGSKVHRIQCGHSFLRKELWSTHIWGYLKQSIFEFVLILSWTTEQRPQFDVHLCNCFWNRTTIGYNNGTHLNRTVDSNAASVTILM